MGSLRGPDVGRIQGCNRVLVLLNALQAGNRSGTGTYVEELARRLPGAAPDLDVRVMWPRDLPVPVEQGNTEGAFIPCNVAGHGRRIYEDQLGVRVQWARHGADAVHYPATFGTVFNMPRVIITVHDVSFLHHPEWFRLDRALYYRLFLKLTLPKAARVIAVSRCTANDLVEHVGLAYERIDVVHEGVSEAFKPLDDAAKAAVRAKYDLPLSFFLFVGTLEPRKNLPRLIEAYAHIAGECEPDLVLAGRPGWKTEPIYRAAAASPQAHRIRLPGAVERRDLPALMSAARALVWPSLFEGFGLPLLEAMACGTPVLASDRSSMPEVAGNAALLVDPENADAIAEGIRRLANDEALHASLRQKGFERAAQFTWARTAAATIESYRSLL